MSLQSLVEEIELEKETTRTVLKGLIAQFENPFQYIRELVQNSRDAGSNEIHISVGRDKQTGLGVISVSDDGCGMNEEDVRKYLLKLFASSKEQDRNTIGRFGVGLVSVFAQKPTKVELISAKENYDPLRVEFGSVEKGVPMNLYKLTERNIELTPSRVVPEGTKVNLYVDLNDEELADTKKNIRAEIENSCIYLDVPLLFDGKRVNKDFEIKSVVSVPFGGERGLEGRIGITGESAYTLLNHRLVLLTGEEFTERTKGLELLVNSRYFDSNISRNAVIQDNRYFKQIRKKVDQAVDILAIKAFQYMATDESGKNENISHEKRNVWEFGLQYLREMLGTTENEKPRSFFGRFLQSQRLKQLEHDLPAEILDAHMFASYDDKPVSLREVVRAVRKQKCTYFSENTHLAREAENEGLLVLQEYCDPKPFRGWIDAGKPEKQIPYITKILQCLGDVQLLERKFHVSSSISRDMLSEEQRQLLVELEEKLSRVSKLKKHIRGIEFGSFKSVEVSTGKKRTMAVRPYVSLLEGNLSGRGYGSRKLHEGFKERFFDWRRGDTMLLNMNHPFVESLLEDRGVHRRNKQYSLLMSMAIDKTYDNHKLSGSVSDAYHAELEVSQ